jgi:hypothetical protein
LQRDKPVRLALSLFPPLACRVRGMPARFGRSSEPPPFLQAKLLPTIRPSGAVGMARRLTARLSSSREGGTSLCGTGIFGHVGRLLRCRSHRNELTASGGVIARITQPANPVGQVALPDKCYTMDTNAVSSHVGMADSITPKTDEGEPSTRISLSLERPTGLLKTAPSSYG